MIYLAINLAFIVSVLVIVAFYKCANFCSEKINDGGNEALWTTLQFELPAFIILNTAIFVKVNG